MRVGSLFECKVYLTCMCLPERPFVACATRRSSNVPVDVAEVHTCRGTPGLDFTVMSARLDNSRPDTFLLGCTMLCYDGCSSAAVGSLQETRRGCCTVN